ncbi:MAG TPA: VOC family protein [Longimicrobiales bacterium]|nr:VOC family protein [Longimicrobiales bacterium]
MKATSGFHHITMVSSDAARTVRFYRDHLGVGLVKRTVNYDDPGSYHLYFGDEQGTPGTLLTFFEWPGASRGHFGAGGIHHLALGVETPEAQLKWKRWLQDRGIPVTGPYDRGWFRSIYFEDPDGQILEIATKGPGYDVDEPADALGREVVIPQTAELRGARDDAAIDARSWPEPVDGIGPDMRLDGIHHITGITYDVGEVGEFYEAALGLRLVKRSVNQDDPSTPHWFWASYDGRTVAPRSSLTMFGAWAAGGVVKPGRPRRPREGAGQTHHIAFRAEDDDHQAEILENLRGLGVATSQVLDRSYFRSIYFRAPDGLLMEVATDGPGFAVDEKPGRLGEQLVLPRWLEDRREELSSRLAALPEAL